MAFRPCLLAAAAVLPMSLVACGGDDGQPVPEGMHYHYVVNKAFVPTTNTEARQYGLDLNDDDIVDNQLGMVLSTLAGLKFDVQATIDAAVAEGSIELLVDFQTKDFTNTAAAGIQIFLGENEMPAACNADETYDEVTMTGCGHHLDGNASFSIAANSPDNAALAGKIINGKFTGGSEDSSVSLQIALGGTEAIQLDLIGARAQATGISETGISDSLILAGAVTKDDIDTKVIPAVHGQLAPILTRDCTTTTPPECGCADGSTGATVISVFDTTPKDCMVTIDEIKNNQLIVSLLAPDVEIQGKKALSLGIKATAVKAMYTVAGQ